jgi:hypothetical protein
MCRWWLGIAVCLGAFATPAVADVTDAEVQAAIERLRGWLYLQQNEATGSFDGRSWAEVRAQPYHATGETALITYALLLSGESYQSPRLTRAIEYLKANRVESTYLASMRAHIWATLPDDFLPLLKQEAQYLTRAETGGRFHYQIGHPTWSNSLTQYGTLGLWEFRKRGGETDERFWRRVGDHIITHQNDDGGWGYNDGPGRGGGDSTGSMTSAGVVILQVLQQEIFADDKTPNPVITKAIDRGVAWLDERFDPADNAGLGERYRFYTLYGIERIALASGLSNLNGRDWFEAGARFILDEEGGDGNVSGDDQSGEMSDRISTAFALSFLSRGRVPLWVSKLRLADAPWNQRPNDLYLLTRFLSDQREAELNWQVVDLDTPPVGWLRAPVLYLSLEDPVKLTDEQLAAIKRYLDLGGLLMVNPEGRSSGRLMRWVEQWAKQLYPEYEFEEVEAEHPFASLITDLSRGRGRLRPQLRTLSNGARDLIVVPTRDWGEAFQTGDPGDGDPWDYLTNLYAAVTDRGQLNNRLDKPLPQRDVEREATGTVTVVRALHAGHADAEPAALEVAGIDLFNRSGKQLAISAQPIEQIAAGDERPDVVHLAGTKEVELTEAELATLQRYVEAGGTVLVETVGGRGTFADPVAGQLAEALGVERGWLDAGHPVVTGKGLEGGVDAGTARYRAYSQLTGDPGDRPSLGALTVNDRPAVVISTRDLSLGALGSRHYRINGYEPATARALLGNLLLWAAGSEAR